MGYVTNNYRFRKLNGKYFVTTDSGSWIVLDETDFMKLKSGKVEGGLRKRLTEREIIIDENNMDEFARDLRKRNSFLFLGTSLHIIVITLRCNMKCVYCHASSASEDKKELDMGIEAARKTVDFIFQTPSKNITIEFQGGEPLLNWDAVKFVIEYALQKNKKEGKNVRFSLVTNLTIMDDEKMDYLADRDVNICTSLDGPRKLHDKNRIFTKASSYEKAVYWIKRINEEYAKRKSSTRAGALVTLTKESMKYPDEIVDEYVNLGLQGIHLRFLHNLGVAQKSWPLLSYTEKEYMDFWKKALERIKMHQCKGVNFSERIVDIITEKISSKLDPNYLDLRSPCGAAIGQLAYDYNGDIYTCDEGRMLGNDAFLLGNVSKDKYKDVVTCEKACSVVNASLNDQFVCDSCAYKPYCGLCPVCSFASTGSLVENVSQSFRCRIFRQQFDWVVLEKFINQDGSK